MRRTLKNLSKDNDSRDNGLLLIWLREKNEQREFEIGKIVGKVERSVIERIYSYPTARHGRERAIDRSWIMRDAN